MPRTLKVVLAYDGTRFVGWQRQPAGVSVQGCLEEALGRIEGSPVAVTGAGRTDAGVHALGQVASARLSHPIPLPDLLRALNAILPLDLRIVDVAEVEPDFHARYSAKSKTYRYLFACGASLSPFEDRYVTHVPVPLDGSQMANGARFLEGEHDFACFRSVGTRLSTARRHVFSSEIRECTFQEMFGSALQPVKRAADVRLFSYEVTADGFLRHMVRAIAGSLIEIGTRRRDCGWLRKVLESGDRDEAGPTAPAKGLFLVRVGY